MRAATSRFAFAALGLLTGACALAGYDFGDYERGTETATTTAGGAANGGSANGIAITTTPFGSAGGDASTAAGQGAGGEATSGGPAVSAAAGESGAVGGAGPEPTTFCEPRGCFELGLACGPADDGCGQPLDCGPCFWWFQECVENRCEIPE